MQVLVVDKPLLPNDSRHPAAGQPAKSCRKVMKDAQESKRADVQMASEVDTRLPTLRKLTSQVSGIATQRPKWSV